MTLREARKRRRLTQEQLAAISGVDQTTISNLERGAVQSPSWETVARLCSALNIDNPRRVFPVELAGAR